METMPVYGHDLDNGLKKVIAQHEGKKDELIELLCWVQDNYGYVSRDAMRVISDGMNVPLSTIYSIITFFSTFSLYPKEGFC